MTTFKGGRLYAKNEELLDCLAAGFSLGTKLLYTRHVIDECE